MRLANLLFGRPLRTSEERAEQIGPAQGVPIFGLDALSSAGYGPEAAMTILIPLGAAGLAFLVPISAAIILLLTVVYLSYLQTIEAYPGGGGSYIVARANLGEFAGLLAASALMIDYVLVVAVGIAAGVGALVSAVPALQSHTLGLCLLILVLITWVNLRGLSSAGTFFMAPTYFFVAAMGATLAWGGLHWLTGSITPLHPAAAPGAAAASPWLLLQAFASGCTAMTGVEAVSNGIRAFREPSRRNAKITLTVIIAALIVLLAGIAVLSRAYHILATAPGQPGYESVLSQLVRAVAGKGAFYYAAMTSVLLVLALSANTAFADFPRLCQCIAQDGYLPISFAARGRRLVYSAGIFWLFFLAGLLLIACGGVTDRLIPLFAIGAFLAFTLSQAGMVMHWKRQGGSKAWRGILLNGTGAAATAVTVVVVLVAKFVEGAWITALLIPALFLMMKAVRRHYRTVEAELATQGPLELTRAAPPLVIVPILGWSRLAQKALKLGLEMSPEVEALHVQGEGPEEDLRALWTARVVEPAAKAGLGQPRLTVLESPYRFILGPIVDHVIKVSKDHPDRRVAVLIPEVVEDRWYNYLLHTQRASVLKTQLYLFGNARISVTSVPWYLGGEKV